MGVSLELVVGYLSLGVARCQLFAEDQNEVCVARGLLLAAGVLRVVWACGRCCACTQVCMGDGIALRSSGLSLRVRVSRAAGTKLHF